jgi:hypothetical protein
MRRRSPFEGPKDLVWFIIGIALIKQISAHAAVPTPPPAPAPIERELHFVVTVDATQDWVKDDPKHPGKQWSKGSTKQRYELTTRLRSDGKIQVRNLLDPDITERMEAKTIYLAREAKKYMDRPGRPFKLPKTDAEKDALQRTMQEQLMACKGDPTCTNDANMRYASIMAAIAYPEALEEDTVPGRYLYFMPYKGCPEKSRVTLTMSIDGVRFNKDSDTFVPFSERRSADTVDASDGLALCAHFTAVIDKRDPAKPMWQETVFVPRPEGITDYTERGRTSHTPEPQPMPGAAIDWMNDVLRHAPALGSASTTLPLPMSLNGNSTWLGLWTGTAKVSIQWSFKEVPRGQ